MNNRVIGFIALIFILIALVLWLSGCDETVTEKDRLEIQIMDNEKTIYKLESEIENLKSELHKCRSEKEQLNQNIEELEDRNTELEESEEY